MDGYDLMREISKCTPMASHKYVGDVDLNHLRNGEDGTEQWEREYYQKYSGKFLQDSLHGKGRYLWNYDDKKTIFEGNFYANSLEGYGMFSYNDASVFEGLFKGNRRFGPGVFTSADAKQDVGMWMGKDLMRLCRVVNPEWVPRLARSPAAKVKLLKFLKLVQVCDNLEDLAGTILETLNANEDVLRKSSELYSVYIRNPQSIFFNKPLHDNDFYGNTNCYIQVPILTNQICSNEMEMEILATIKTECVGVDANQIRIDTLISELEHTEEQIKTTETKIDDAERNKTMILSCEHINTGERRKSVDWENVEFFADSNTTIKHPQIRQIKDSKDDDGNFELKHLEKSEMLNYEIACQQLTAVQSEIKLLIIKKNNLIKKLSFENTRSHQMNNSNDHEPPTKNVLVTDLLAWNNEMISTNMLKHVFVHRNLEENISFRVADLITGRRSGFRKAGAYEEDCIAFLTQCSRGNSKDVRELFIKRDFNPDLCDAKGNTGIMFAVSQDKLKIIHILTNFGANIDSFNDECFTPLGMCFARYLAVQHDVNDWESAFMKSATLGCDEEKLVREWRPHVSLCSINNIIQGKGESQAERRDSSNLSNASFIRLEALSDTICYKEEVTQNNVLGSLNEVERKFKKLTDQVHGDPEVYFCKEGYGSGQTYILSTECVKPPVKKQPKEKKKAKTKSAKNSSSKSSDKKTSKSSKTSSKGSKSTKTSPEKDEKSAKKSIPLPEEVLPEINPADTLRSNKLNTIRDTINTLLSYGADPNLCEVPLPTLILTIFTKDVPLITELLSYHANPNITMEENLTPLHVLVNLSPCAELVEILKILLEHSADPNLKADKNHWLEEKTKLVANRDLADEDQGKTPLHLLSMRYDFTLDPDEHLNKMVPVLMEYGGRVKEKYLGHTPLSLAILRGNLNLVRTFLETKRVNPNHNLGENMGVPLTVLVLKRYKDLLPDYSVCEQIIELLVEYKANPLDNVDEFSNVIEFMNKEHEKPPQPEKTKGKKGKDGSSKQSSKSGKMKISTQDMVVDFLTAVAKRVLIKHTKGYAVKYLFHSIEEDNIYDNISINTARLVSPQEAIEMVQLLVNRGEISMDEPWSTDILHELVEFVINVNGMPTNSNLLASTGVDIDEMLSDRNFKKVPNELGKLNLPEPEVDQNAEKYNVCFHCLKKDQQQLSVCPKCTVVYFCSEECNKLDNKEKMSVHKCGQPQEIHKEGQSESENETLISKLQELQRYKKEKLNLTQNYRKSSKSPAGEEEMASKVAMREKVKGEQRSSTLHSMGGKTGRNTEMSSVRSQDQLSSKDRKDPSFYERKSTGKLGGGDVEPSQLTPQRMEKDGKQGDTYLDKGGRFKRTQYETGKKRDSKDKKYGKGELELSQVTPQEMLHGEKYGKQGDTSLDKKGGYKKNQYESGEEGDIKVKKYGKGELELSQGTPQKVLHGEKYGKQGDTSVGKEGGYKKNKYESGEEGDIKVKKHGKGELELSQVTPQKVLHGGKYGKQGDTSVGKESGYKKNQYESGEKVKKYDKGIDMSRDRFKTEGGGKKGGPKSERAVKQDTNGRASLGKNQNQFKNENNLNNKNAQDQTCFGEIKHGIIASTIKRTGMEYFNIQKDFNYPTMPTGGRLPELKRRLPNTYQYFLEKLSEIWPDFDITMLFLPYACYSDGQLYYRFVSNKPLYMQTSSNV